MANLRDFAVVFISSLFPAASRQACFSGFRFRHLTQNSAGRPVFLALSVNLLSAILRTRAADVLKNALKRRLDFAQYNLHDMRVMPKSESMGRCRLLTEEQKTKVLLLAEENLTVAEIAKAVGLNHKTALIDHRKRDPQFEIAFQAARVRSCEAFEDAAIELSKLPAEESKRAEFLLKLYQWLTSVRNPHKYGQKLDVHVTQTLDITAALEASNQRVLRAVGPVALSGAVEKRDDPSDVW